MKANLMTDYSDRNLAKVWISGVDRFLDPSGGISVATSVHIDLTGINDLPRGPNIDINLSIPATENMSIEEAELSLIAAAQAVLTRIAKFSVNELKASYAKEFKVAEDTSSPSTGM